MSKYTKLKHKTNRETEYQRVLLRRYLLYEDVVKKQKMQRNTTPSMALIEIQQIAFLTTAAYVKAD